jgi:c-di-GMP-binding flagellar brake protein YcgR
MRRLTRDQVVTLSVGDTAVDCRVVDPTAGEVALVALDADESSLLPAASAGASIVFSHGGRLVMLRGAMYRADTQDDLRFAETTSRAAASLVAEQRRKAARLPITLPATIIQLDASGTPFGEERQLVTRDISIGGFAVGTGVGNFSVGTLVEFQLVLTDGAIIVGTARVVRAANEMSGLKFEKLAPAERVRLAGFLAGQQRGRTARPAGLGAAPPPR